MRSRVVAVVVSNADRQMLHCPRSAPGYFTYLSILSDKVKTGVRAVISTCRYGCPSMNISSSALQGGGHYHDDAIYSLVKLVSKGLMVLRNRSTLTRARQNSLCSSTPLHSMSRGGTFYCLEVYSSACLFNLVGHTNLIFFRKLRTQIVLLLLFFFV